MLNKNQNRLDDEFINKVLFGIRKAVRKLVEASAANNEMLVIGDKDGKPKYISGKEALRIMRQQEKQIQNSTNSTAPH